SSAVGTRRVRHTAVRVGPLTERESEALLDAFFGASVLPASLRDLVVRRSGGNPFYLEEIVRGLIAGRVLSRGAGGGRCRDGVAPLAGPPTLQGLLLSRVARLPPAARRLAQEAAILGLAWDTSLLRAVASDPGGCQAALRLLADADLVEDVTPAAAA